MNKPVGQVNDDSAQIAKPIGGSRPRLEGFVDTLTRQGASGWAWLPEAPQTVVEIEAFHQGRMIGRAMAQQPRPDLLKWGKGTGLYGFTLTFNHLLEGDEPPQFRGVGFGDASLQGATELPPSPGCRCRECREADS